MHRAFPLKNTLCDALGKFDLCYSRIIILQGKKNVYIVQGNIDFTNEETEILVFQKTTTTLLTSEMQIKLPQNGPEPLCVNNSLPIMKTILCQKFFDYQIEEKTRAFGMMGSLSILDGYFLILIQDAEKIGMILKHEIYKVTRIQVFPIYQVTDESKIYKYLNDYLNGDNLFYFSYTYDLTNPLHKNFLLGFKNTVDYWPEIQKPLFMWNNHVADNLCSTNQEFDKNRWIIKLMHGFYEEIKSDVLANTISVHLISRRMVQNSGTRYNRRGLNNMGFAANFVETEQLVINQTLSSDKKPLLSSYIQVRGSVPLYWYQETSFLQPKPPIKSRKNVDEFSYGSQKHFGDMISLYGPKIICLNLMKKAYLSDSHKNQETK